MNASETRKIMLSSGNVLEIEMTHAFADKVRQQFGLMQCQPVEDDHIKMFFHSAVKNAIDKAEQRAINAE